MDEGTKVRLTALSREIRELTIREIGSIGVGHVGGSLSLVEILAYLYGQRLCVRPQEPDWPDRDRLVLSKGHAGPALYAALAAKGYFPKDMLQSLNQLGTRLPSHCDMRLTPGVDMTTGSLGQGLSAALGMALVGTLDNRSYSVFCILGDGELQEGQNWEAAMYAGSRRVSNLVAIVDDNGMQIDGHTADINNVEDIAGKFRAFGWNAVNIDGHDFDQIEHAFELERQTKDCPVVIVMRTVKGKGISLAEGRLASHNMPVSPEDVERAVREIRSGAGDARRRDAEAPEL